MTLIKGMGLNIVLFLILDTIWLKAVAGDFFQKQLSEIARIGESGNWDVRMGAAALVYILMALSIELFIFQNPRIKTGKDNLIFGALLGLIVYGVFDLTNRAILEEYPLPMVIVDMGWGTFLYASVSYLSFVIKDRLTFF